MSTRLRSRDVGVRFWVVGAAALGLEAAAFLPWATRHTFDPNKTVAVHPDWLRWVLGALGIAVIVLASANIVRRTERLDDLAIGIGCAGVFVSLWAALASMARANRLPSAGPVSTHWGSGAPLAIIASVAVIAACGSRHRR